MDVYRNPASLIERTLRLEEENRTLAQRVTKVRQLEEQVMLLRAKLRRHRAVRFLELIACAGIITMGLTATLSILLHL